MTTEDQPDDDAVTDIGNGMPPELGDAITRAQTYLAHLRDQHPDLPAGVMCMLLLSAAADARDLGEPHYSHALTGAATRLALDYRHHVISAAIN